MQKVVGAGCLIPDFWLT